MSSQVVLSSFFFFFWPFFQKRTESILHDEKKSAGLCNTKPYFEESPKKKEAKREKGIQCGQCQTLPSIKCTRENKPKHRQDYAVTVCLEGLQREQEIKKKLKRDKVSSCSHAHMLCNWLLKAFVIAPKKERHCDQDRQKEECIGEYRLQQQSNVKREGNDGNIKKKDTCKKATVKEEECLLIWHGHGITFLLLFLFLFPYLHRLIANGIFYEKKLTRFFGYASDTSSNTEIPRREETVRRRKSCSLQTVFLMEKCSSNAKDIVKRKNTALDCYQLWHMMSQIVGE